MPSTAPSKPPTMANICDDPASKSLQAVAKQFRKELQGSCGFISPSCLKRASFCGAHLSECTNFCLNYGPVACCVPEKVHMCCDVDRPYGDLVSPTKAPSAGSDESAFTQTEQFF